MLNTACLLNLPSVLSVQAFLLAGEVRILWVTLPPGWPGLGALQVICLSAHLVTGSSRLSASELGKTGSFQPPYDPCPVDSMGSVAQIPSVLSRFWLSSSLYPVSVPAVGSHTGLCLHGRKVNLGSLRAVLIIA